MASVVWVKAEGAPGIGWTVRSVFRNPYSIFWITEPGYEYDRENSSTMRRLYSTQSVVYQRTAGPWVEIGKFGTLEEAKAYAEVMAKLEAS